MGAARLIMDPQQLGLAAPSRERGVGGAESCPVEAVLLSSEALQALRASFRGRLA
jgi:hypothetical protein